MTRMDMSRGVLLDPIDVRSRGTSLAPVAAAPAAPMKAPTRELGYVMPGQNWGQWWTLAIEETAPELRWPLSIQVFDQMRRTDAQVASVLRAVTLPILRSRFWVEPSGARDEVVQFVAGDLGLPIHGSDDEMDARPVARFSWEEHVRLALLKLSYGHMFFEQVAEIRADGRAHLAKLGPRMPRTITAVSVAEDGGLISIDQANYGTAVTIPVERLVAYVHEREGGNWLGTSLLRPAYKNWLLKDRALRVQMQSLERNGLGIPLYTGAEGEQDLSNGAALAQGWRVGDNSGAAVPFGAELTLVGVEGRVPDAGEFIRYCDEQIARAVLAHFLNLGTQTGSWALGSTFADFFTTSLQAVAREIADTASRHVVADIVAWNWGPDEPVPSIGFEEIGAGHNAMASAVAQLAIAGVIQPDRTLEEAMRELFGLPPKQLPAPAPVPANAG